MQYIKSRIAEMYNTATGLTGAFWNERFGSVVIEETDDPQQYLFHLLWYIGYDPVNKGLSSNPRNNYIKFLNVYLEENFKLDIKITRHQYFMDLGNSFDECVTKFLFYENYFCKK